MNRRALLNGALLAAVCWVLLFALVLQILFLLGLVT
jgi:hypothetical protein